MYGIANPAITACNPAAGLNSLNELVARGGGARRNLS